MMGLWKPAVFPFSSTRVGSSTVGIGARGATLGEPLVVDTTYSIQWQGPRVNLAELAKLRYLEGWSRERLARHYGRTLNAITNYCQNIRRKGFEIEGLTKEEKDLIKRSYQVL
jgi:hypothetical protein